MKICTKCNISKPEEKFPFKNRLAGRRSTVCSECQKQYKRAYYQKNKQSHFDRNRKKRSQMKERLLMEKEKGCLVCSEKCIECLDFHHLDPSKKDINVSRLVTYTSFQKLENEISKCVLLCATCHRKVHAGLLKLDL